jgi:hypothetical protein
MSQIEWAPLAAGKVVIATANGAWLHSPAIGSPFTRPMTGPGSVPAVRNLLDAAVRAGWAAAHRIAVPPLTVHRWAYRLSGFYQTTHATPVLMLEVAERFASSGRDSLAQWAETKVREEQGHDELALRDLRDLGYDADEVVKVLVPPGPAALVRYLERQVRAEEPVGCVGYAYALERSAIEVDERYIEHVESILPPGRRATRCLRVHSSVGSDQKHVQETAELVASLPPDARARIAVACYETAVLCSESHEREPPDETSLEQRLYYLKRKGEHPYE